MKNGKALKIVNTQKAQQREGAGQLHSLVNVSVMLRSNIRELCRFFSLLWPPSLPIRLSGRLRQRAEDLRGLGVELYIHDVLASTTRPLKERKGVLRIHLAPGEEKDVTFELNPKHLQRLNREMEWVVEPEAFRILVGRSSKDIRLGGTLEVK